MKHRGPGRANRAGISLAKLFSMFPDDAAAHDWLCSERWPDGVACCYCGSENVQTGAKHKSMPFRCRDCRKRFSVRTGTVMQSSKLGHRTWVIAIYLLTTNLKGVSSLKLHRDLDITQKSAWHLAHRLRETWRRSGGNLFSGPVEADETFVGGKLRNMHAKKRRALEGGMHGGNKMIVAGVRDRRTKQVKVRVISKIDGPTLHGLVRGATADGASIFTDEGTSYQGLPNHRSVKHTLGQYVDGMAHTNGIESFWSMLKRGYAGVFHRMSPEHLHRYVTEFEGRHNDRDLDTERQMAEMVRGAEGKRLPYLKLTSHGGRRARAV